MINIVNFILVRNCNLSCEYCRISGNTNYELKPEEYPDLKYYIENEQPVEKWIDVVNEVLKVNPQAFFLLVGGEPFLYKGLTDLVIHLNEVGANYTIISNCTDGLKPIRKHFFKKVGRVRGFTCSVDPIDGTSGDSQLKSQVGFQVLKDLIEQDLVDDPVAELTLTSKNIHKAEDTVKMLSDAGIYSDITVMDISKTNYYDFSDIMESELLVPKNEEVKQIFDKLINSDYKIHMKETLLPAIYDMLPANLDCELTSGNVQNLTFDSDLSVRLCYRIKGHFCTQFNALDYFSSRDDVEEALQADYEVLCKGCSWSCMIMSALDHQDVIDH